MPVRISLFSLLTACFLIVVAGAEEPATETESNARHELLTTVEAVENHVRDLIKSRKAMNSYAIEVTSEMAGGENRRTVGSSRVWVNGNKLRQDLAKDDSVEIFTPDYNINFEKGKWTYHPKETKAGWTNVPDYSQFGIGDRWHARGDESHEAYLLPDDRKNVKVEIGKFENHRITIVKFDREINTTKAWTQYWLSPKYGNSPVFLEYGWMNKDKDGADSYKTLISQSIRWKQYGDVWFPEKLTHVRRDPTEKIDRRVYTVRRARFNLNPFPDVFSPEATMMKFR